MLATTTTTTTTTATTLFVPYIDLHVTKKSEIKYGGQKKISQPYLGY